MKIRIFLLCCLSSAALLLPGCEETGDDLPWTFSGAAGGCGDFIVYRQSDDGLAAVFIRAVTDSLDLDENGNTYDLSRNHTGLSVSLHVFEENAVGYYCVTHPPNLDFETWSGIDGTIGIQIEEGDSLGYHVSAQLEKIVFTRDNESLTLKEMSFEAVWVGWYPH